MRLGIPTGPLRAPGDNGLAFVFQSFIDEMAHAAGKDPLAFQIDLLGKDELLPGRGEGFNTGRARARAGKGARGVRLGPAQRCRRAPVSALPSTTAISAISPKWWRPRSPNDGQVKINHVWAVGDIGSHVINPTAALNMTQGGILDGFGEALNQKITIENGHVVQANFDSFCAVAHVAGRVRSRCTSSPPITSPTGLGEPPLPAAIPALCNAIFAATGKRVRSLPVDTDMLKA